MRYPIRHFLTLLAFVCAFPGISQEARDLFPIKKDGKWGYMDRTGLQVIPAVYELTLPDGYKTVNLVKDNKGYLLIDNKNNVLTSERYVALDDGEGSGLISVKNNDNLWGCIDTAGKTVLPFIHHETVDYVNGIATAVLPDGTKGYYDLQFKFHRIDGFDEVSGGNEGFLLVTKLKGKRKRVGIYDLQQQKLIVPPVFATIGLVKNGHAVAKDTLTTGDGILDVRTGKFTLQPRKGQMILTSTYHTGIRKSTQLNLLYSVLYNEKTKVTDYRGKVLFEPWKQYPGCYVRGFYDGFAVISQHGKEGLITSEGKVVIEPVYDRIQWVSEGMAGVMQYKHWGFTDMSGKVIIPMQFDDAMPFFHGLSMVFVNGNRDDIRDPDKTCKMGYIDSTGYFIWTLSR